MIAYKGYISAVNFGPEIDLFHGTVINTTDVITFYGASVTELREEMQIVYYRATKDMSKLLPVLEFAYKKHSGN
ncbi:MAG: hypothetical protein OXI61_13085 [Candidatus Poribacteria bacterium]|nr:hypothetical protein [Candidatus Poribacteria bacterium]